MMQMTDFGALEGDSIQPVIFRTRWRSWVTGSAILLTVALALTAGVLAALGSPGVVGAFVAVPALLVVGLRTPVWVFSVLYPATWVVGQVPIPIGQTTISLERGLLVFAAFGMLGMVLQRRIQVPLLPRLVVVGMALWLGAYVVSLIVHYSADGLQNVLGFAQKVALGWMVFVALDSVGRIRLVTRLYLYATLLASLMTVAVFLQFGQLDPLRYLSFASGDSLGENLTYGIARAGAGGFLAPWIAIMEMRGAQTQRERIIWTGLALWLFGISMTVLRREVLITVPLGILALILYRPLKMTRTRFLFGAIVLFTMLSIVTLSPQWQHRLFDTTVEKFATGEDARLVLLRFSWQAFLESPWLGYGPGKYIEAQWQFTPLLTTEIRERGGSAAHNSLAAAAVEGGIFAIAGLLIFLYAVARYITSGRPPEREQGLYLLWSFAPILFLQILLRSMFGDSISASISLYWIGVLLAVGKLAHIGLRPADTEPSWKDNRSPTRR